MTKQKTKPADVSASVILSALRKEAKRPTDKISSLTIKSNEDLDTAAVLLKELKSYAKQADDKEKSLTEPLTKVVKDIRALFKPFKDSIEQIEADTKLKMSVYLEQNKAALKKLDADFDSGKIKKVSTLVTKQAVMHISSSSMQVRKTWTAIEVDAKKTPREYLVPDLPSIKEALKAGKKVAGWKWEQVDTIAV